jgi:hypothetical protein
MRNCVRAIPRSKNLTSQNKKAPAGCEAEGALATNQTRHISVVLEMI